MTMDPQAIGRLEAGQVDVQQKLDTSVPHSARIWNYWLGVPSTPTSAATGRSAATPSTT
ncbi:SAM-dependent methyltransferase [Micromonospora sp. NBC_00389]|uniref:hypothetical protein n=1 Tax=Micromonospora sp. NBC_00389 TaxID=2903586 RepID=UPI002E24988D